uniref:Chromo domain-containing protein n=1 Tax=Panagrellus redivivus TaxID=6233 RepID=A0A7E4W882_PANRE
MEQDTALQATTVRLTLVAKGLDHRKTANMRTKKPVIPPYIPPPQQAREPRQPSPYDPNRTYTVNKIVNHKTDKKTKQVLYRVNWVGYSASEDTWEPAENILDQTLINKYRESCDKRSKQKRKATLSRSTGNQAKRAKRPTSSRSGTEADGASIHDHSGSNDGGFPDREALFAGNNDIVPRTPTPQLAHDNEPTEGQFDVLDEDEVVEEGHQGEDEEWRQVVNDLERDRFPRGDPIPEGEPSSRVAKLKKSTIVVETDDEEDLAFYGRPNDNPNDRADYTLADKKDPKATVKIQVPATAEVNGNDDLIAVGESAEGISDPGPSTSHTTQSQPEQDSASSDSNQYQNDITVTSVTSDNLNVNIYEI